jgi:hypothetical protein
LEKIDGTIVRYLAHVEKISHSNSSSENIKDDQIQSNKDEEENMSLVDIVDSCDVINEQSFDIQNLNNE